MRSENVVFRMSVPDKRRLERHARITQKSTTALILRALGRLLARLKEEEEEAVKSSPPAKSTRCKHPAPPPPPEST